MAPCSVSVKEKRHELSECACVSVCVCLCVCKTYVSSAQGCYELIFNEAVSGSRRRCTIEINSLFRSRYRRKDL